MKHILLLLSLALPVLSHAALKESAGHWQGSGSVFDASGQEVTPFTVTVTNTLSGPASIDSEAIVVLPGGRKKSYQQHIVAGEDGFTIETPSGKGKGGCFGEGLCLSYVGDDKHGVSTTIVKDGLTGMRMISTELDHGKPVEFIRQRLQRVN